MSPPRPPAHALFIKYGKLEAAAYGRWAVIGLVTLIALASAIALRLFGLL
jgi:hypothetical protein